MRLVPDALERATLVAQASDLVEGIERRHGSTAIHADTPSAIIAQMRVLPGEEPLPVEIVFSRLASAAQFGWDKGHGGDVAYIPSGGLYSGAIAAWLAAAVHAFTAASFEAPALVALEQSVLSWLATVVGMPADAEGILLSGGSLANQTAIVCARERCRTGYRPIVYLTPRVHHSVRKGLRLSGILDAEATTMPADARGGVDVSALRRQIAADQAAGATPWLLVAAAGDTDAGRVDPLNELADIAADTGAWLHVDAAYGGFFALTERGARRLRGIERADSITIDAHKSLFLPYGIGGLLVRHPGVLAQAHSADGAYLRDVHETDTLPHYFDRGPENTRPFRGLLAWLPLHLHGVAAFRDMLDQMLDLAADVTIRLRDIPGIEAADDPQLSIALFRSAEGDDETQRILGLLNNSGKLHVSSTIIDDRITIRLAFLHPRSDSQLLDDIIQLVEQSKATTRTR